MSLRFVGLFPVFSMLLVPVVAFAEDVPDEDVVDPSTTAVPSDIRYGVSAGAVEVLTAMHVTHVGAYGIVGGNAVVPLGASALIPALSFEYSPDTSAWGGVLTLTLDTPLATMPVGLDITGILLSDQVGSDVTLAALYGGLGAGVTWIIGDHWSCSGAMNAYHGINPMAASGWTAGPIAFVGYAF